MQAKDNLPIVRRIMRLMSYYMTGEYDWKNSQGWAGNSKIFFQDPGTEKGFWREMYELINEITDIDLEEFVGLSPYFDNHIFHEIAHQWADANKFQNMKDVDNFLLKYGQLSSDQVSYNGVESYVRSEVFNFQNSDLHDAEGRVDWKKWDALSEEEKEKRRAR